MSKLPTAFTPVFKRVAQSCEFDDAFACIAMLTGKTIPEIRQLAIDKFKHPKNGPYWINEALICNLLAHYKLLGTVYKEFAEPLPDVCILMIDYVEATEIGRHVLYHKGMFPDGKGGQAQLDYIIDPAYWIPAERQINGDWKALKPAWYIGVSQMKA
jgi:hypothetical protein